MNEYSIWKLITKISRKNIYKENIELYSITNNKWIINSNELNKYKEIKKYIEEYQIIQKWEIWYNWNKLHIWSIWIMKDEKWLISSLYTIFKLNNNIILSNYFDLILKSNNIKYKINLLCIPAWSCKIKFDFQNWNKIFIKVPSLERQQQLINYLNILEEYQKEITKEIKLVDKQFNYCLNKIFIF